MTPRECDQIGIEEYTVVGEMVAAISVSLDFLCDNYALLCDIDLPKAIRVAVNLDDLQTDVIANTIDYSLAEEMLPKVLIEAESCRLSEDSWIKLSKCERFAGLFSALVCHECLIDVPSLAEFVTYNACNFEHIHLVNCREFGFSAAEAMVFRKHIRNCHFFSVDNNFIHSGIANTMLNDNHFPNLTFLSIRDHCIDGANSRWLRLSHHFPCLEELNLSENMLSDNDLDTICNNLPETLRYCHLQHNLTTARGVNTIRDAKEKNPKITFVVGLPAGLSRNVNDFTSGDDSLIII